MIFSASWLIKLRGSVIVGIGYMLSPLSWWNDLVFNLPIALAVGYAVSWVIPDWFLPGTIVGYWLSNVLGIVMMQFGVVDIVHGENPRNLRRELLVGIVSSTLYSLIVTALVLLHVVELPNFLQ